MNYQETVSYLFSQLPMFQRVGAVAFKKSLDNILALSKVCGNPHKDFKSIHIAGTNGKGSTAHLLASTLQYSDLKVGLYTSPHLSDFRERIKVNGQCCEERFVVEFVQKYSKQIEKIKPSFFEITVAMAFSYFSELKVDIAVIETGMGGRLDSTNIITPLVSVITNISNDHGQYLGDTLQKIAGEKAGIIKKGIPVVIGENQEEVLEVFMEKAEELGSPFYIAENNYHPHKTYLQPKSVSADFYFQHKPKYTELSTDLLGHYQLKNMATALQTIEVLRMKGMKIEDSAVYKGFSTAKETTGLLGRWTILNETPLTICDIAHNKAGLENVISQIEKTSYEHLHIVFGMVNDKEIGEILDLLPKKAIYYFCKPNVPRGLDVNELQLAAKKSNLIGYSYPSVEAAIASATEEASPTDLIYIGGSTFVVAEAITNFKMISVI